MQRRRLAVTAAVHRWELVRYGLGADAWPRQCDKCMPFQQLSAHSSWIWVSFRPHREMAFLHPNQDLVKTHIFGIFAWLHFFLFFTPFSETRILSGCGNSEIQEYPPPGLCTNCERGLPPNQNTNLRRRASPGVRRGHPAGRPGPTRRRLSALRGGWLPFAHGFRE